MNTFNTVEELIQILDANPDMLEALRSRILTQELLNLPQTHSEFVVEVREFVATTNTNFQRLNTPELLNLPQAHAEFVAEMRSFVATMNDFVEATNRNFQRLNNDFGNFRGAYAESAARKSSIGIVMELSEDRGLGLDEITFRNLTQKDLAVMARKSGDISDLSRGELRSFYQSDLVIEANDASGETHYIAVEASYTCNGRDTTRALSHTRLLKRFTGRPTHPVVAGVRRDIGIQPDIDDGKVFWHQIDEDQLKP